MHRRQSVRSPSPVWGTAQAVARRDSPSVDGGCVDPKSTPLSWPRLSTDNAQKRSYPRGDPRAAFHRAFGLGPPAWTPISTSILRPRRPRRPYRTVSRVLDPDSGRIWPRYRRTGSGTSPDNRTPARLRFRRAQPDSHWRPVSIMRAALRHQLCRLFVFNVTTT